ncbi:hypothetical protein AwErysi_02910 [Erysipelotrichaceae bacterium]|nr:hypothetical protein AwErysi_02910 [Erysipelotrichaceae bacterium]
MNDTIWEIIKAIKSGDMTLEDAESSLPAAIFGELKKSFTVNAGSALWWAGQRITYDKL